MLPIIDRIGRRFLLLSGAVICAILHYTSGALMAVHGHYVDSVDGKDLRTKYRGLADTAQTTQS
jgi:hypothetical protein